MEVTSVTVACTVILGFFTTLLRNNSYTISCTRVRFTIQWFLVCSQSSAIITTSLKHFCHPPPLSHPVTAMLVSIPIYLPNQYWVLCDWLLARSIMFSKFIHIVTCISTSFPFIDERYSILQVYRFLLIHSPDDGHLECVHVWAVMNIAVTNFIYKFLWGHVFHFSFFLFFLKKVLFLKILFIHF